MAAGSFLCATYPEGSFFQYFLTGPGFRKPSRGGGASARSLRCLGGSGPAPGRRGLGDSLGLRGHPEDRQKRRAPECRDFSRLAGSQFEDSPHRRHREGERTPPPRLSAPALCPEEVSYGEGGFQSQEVLRSASLLEAPGPGLHRTPLATTFPTTFSLCQTVEQKKVLSFLEENRLLSHSLSEKEAFCFYLACDACRGLAGSLVDRPLTLTENLKLPGAPLSVDTGPRSYFLTYFHACTYAVREFQCMRLSTLESLGVLSQVESCAAASISLQGIDPPSSWASLPLRWPGPYPEVWLPARAVALCRGWEASCCWAPPWPP